LILVDASQGVSPAFQGLAVPASGAATGFADAIGKAAMDAAQTLRRTEAMSMDGIAGRAGIQDVVESVMQAERTMTTALAVRDKIVTAVLDISRMQI
jgi:flagellar hook-basal body complex protein FliE